MSPKEIRTASARRLRPAVVGSALYVLGRIGLATLVALTLAAVACGDRDDAASGAGSDAVPGPETEARTEPAMAPSYSAITLEGDTVTLASLRGEAVLLNVWATWCTPCRQEIPELQALHDEHAGQGLRVVGVTVDHRGAESDIRRFIDDFGMTYDIWWDPDQTAVSTFEAVGVPLTVLIDRDGRIAWRHLGAFQRGDPELREAVERALDLGSEAAGAPGS